MNLRRRLNCLLLVCAIVLLGVATMGTAMAAEYHGQVTFSNLPVPGAIVTATQGDKKLSSITDDQGLYSFPDLADGKWSIAVAMTGFAAAAQDVTIPPGGPVAAIEIKLLSLEQIRIATNPIKVDASAPVQMAAATTLPSAPGAAGAPGASGAKGAAAPAKGAGAKGAGSTEAAAPAPPATDSQSNDGFLINGSVNNAATSQYAMSQAFGNTRNGHSLYNYGFSLQLNDSALNARPYSLNGENTVVPAYDNIVAGVSFGGPIKLPHWNPRNFRIDFLNYQRTQDNSESTPNELLPTLAERGGNLAQVTTPINVPAANLLSSACLSSGVKPGQPFAGNQIPTACISSTAAALLHFYPTPTDPTNLVDNYQVALPSNTRGDAVSLRLSKPFGNKDYLFGGINLSSSRTGSTSMFGFHDSTDGLNLGGNITWSHRFSQRLYMNPSYSFTRSRTKSTPYFANRENVEGGGATVGGVAIPQINGVDTDPNYWGPPGLGFSSGVAGLGDSSSSYNRRETNSASLEVDWNRSRHNIAAGGDFNRQEFNYLSQANPRGSFGFTGALTGSDLADFLLGIPDTSSIGYGNADKYLRQSQYDLYARDDFRVNPELSINYGVRWEYGSPTTETKGRLVNLDVAPGFTAEAPVLASNPKGSVSGIAYPTSLVRPDKIGVAPNVGIAWRPISGSSLLVRSGYQISHDTGVYQQTALLMATQAPLSISSNFNNATLLAGSGCPASLTLTQAFPAGCSSSVPDNFGMDPNFRVGYLQLWYLTVQRDLPFSLQMIATYQGNKGTHGVQEFLPNTYAYGGTDPYPSTYPVGFLYRTSNGNSTREAGIMQLRRRLRSGLAGGLTYTYAKALDDDYSFGGNQGSSSSPQVAQDWQHPNAQRGLSTFDQRNSLSVQLQYTTGMGIGGRTLMSGWKGLIYKEWTVQTTFGVANGTPETPVYTATVPSTNSSSVFRANRVAGQPLHGSTPNVYINPNAFAPPAPGQFGNARRDSIPGPDTFSLNASMARNFRVRDRYSLNAEIDASNVLNHVVYSGYYTTVNTPVLVGGVLTPSPNPLFGTPSNTNGMRSLSATLRLRF